MVENFTIVAFSSKNRSVASYTVLFTVFWRIKIQFSNMALNDNEFVTVILLHFKYQRSKREKRFTYQVVYAKIVLKIALVETKVLREPTGERLWLGSYPLARYFVAICRHKTAILLLMRFTWRQIPVLCSQWKVLWNNLWSFQVATINSTAFDTKRI